MRMRVSAVTRAVATLESALRHAGAPTTSENLHWPCPFYLEAVRRAGEIRNRYTFLDMAADSGFPDDIGLV